MNVPLKRMLILTDQRLDLCKAAQDDPEPIKGQIVISLMSREGTSATGAGRLAIVGPAGEVRGPDNEEDESSLDLPEGWEERKTPNGRVYYVNHVMKTTQWNRPIRPAIESQSNGDDVLSGPSRSNTCTNIANEIVESCDSTPRRASEPAVMATIVQEELLGNLVAVKNGDVSNRNLVKAKSPIRKEGTNAVSPTTSVSPTVETIMENGSSSQMSPRNSMIQRYEHFIFVNQFVLMYF